MSTWPLERIPHLDFRALAAILQSMTQAALGRHTPLGLPAVEPDVFAARRWEALGCGGDTLESVARQYAVMFNVPVSAPAPEETAGALVERTLAAWREAGSLVTFHTSGSTGTPKPCTHPEAHLRQELIGVAPLVADRRAALVTAPLHHMYGFTFGLLLPMSLGIPIRTQPPLPTAVAAQMRPGDLVVGIPLLWTRLAALAREKASGPDGRDITIFTATSPTPPEVLRALGAWGFRTIEFFGASETGVMCWRDAPDTPFTLLPHLRRGPEAQPGKELERPLPDGTFRWYPLLDSVTWVDDRHLLPGGRRDSAVQVAGINVFPRHVAEVLEEHEGVRECSVRLMRPEEGDRLKAFVVPKPGWEAKALRASLAAYARGRLRDAERPARYTLGEELPRSLVGKPADW